MSAARREGALACKHACRQGCLRSRQEPRAQLQTARLRNKYSRKRGLSERARARFLKGANRMSVIGRLDEQVDEVLIRPLSKKDKQEKAEREKEDQALR